MKKLSWMWLVVIPLLGSVVTALIRPTRTLINSRSYIWGTTTNRILVVAWISLLLIASLYSILSYLTHLKKNTVPEVVVGGVGLMLGGAAGNLLQLLFHGGVADFQQIMLAHGNVLNASAGDILVGTGFLMTVLGAVGYLLVGRNIKASV